MVVFWLWLLWLYKNLDQTSLGGGDCPPVHRKTTFSQLGELDQSSLSWHDEEDECVHVREMMTKMMIFMVMMVFMAMMMMVKKTIHVDNYGEGVDKTSVHWC